MAKNKTEPEMISYGNLSLLVDTIAGFYPFQDTKSIGPDDYGIKFFLRSGDSITAQGNSKILRDRVVKYLQTRITTVIFLAQRCHACANFEQRPGTDSMACVREYLTAREDGRCVSYEGYQEFKPKPEEECTVILSKQKPAVPVGQ